MRMRYERRDPRPEDLRQIDELKSIVDSQEKDIFDLTEQLREVQLYQQQQQMQNHQNQAQQNANQSKKNKNKNNKNSNNNRNNINNISSNGNSNNNTQQQPQQTQQNANHEQQQRMKPPPLIKTIIYEEENENELYEQQIREERENAKKIRQQEIEAEMHQQQDGVTVELVPESPDYQNKNFEEISEAHIVSDMNNIPDVVVAPSPHDKLQDIRVEVISTIEPANIQIVPFERSECNGHSTIDMELDWWVVNFVIYFLLFSSFFFSNEKSWLSVFFGARKKTLYLCLSIYCLTEKYFPSFCN